MEFQFKTQQFQSDAADSIVRVFAGQTPHALTKYRLDLGKRKNRDKQKYDQLTIFEETAEQKRKRLADRYYNTTEDMTTEDIETLEAAYRNAEVELTRDQLLKNIHAVQTKNNIKYSDGIADGLGVVSLDVEMETGTGKTYVYIKTMFELHEKYGWGKFIIVVPSIAIREGVLQSFEITQEHFMSGKQGYKHKARFFVYNSGNLHQLDEYSQNPGISVMIINTQAFNTTLNEEKNVQGRSGNEAARIIYTKRDEFGSRRPIDVIKANRPIIILDEPQKMGGVATQNALKKNFNPLFSLNFSATHKTSHNLVYVLDALDAYKQKLVKKIEVKGFELKNLAGTNCYMYLAAIVLDKKKAPRARLEIEVKRSGGIKRETFILGVGDSLYAESKGLEEYRGISVADVDPIRAMVTFSNGDSLIAGEASGNVNEDDIRRIQIRETIYSHFEKEEKLFEQGIKCLSLFFIDEVSKYRQYSEDGEEILGEYGRVFEEEYTAILNDNLTLFPTKYQDYLRSIKMADTHRGYFSIDKKGQAVNSAVKRGSEFSDDISAYDLILKNKKRLLSFDEPTRFIFSHSALREGWDNPNVFQICTLKHSDNTVAKRQEVGRGLRLCVNNEGERQDIEAVGETLVHSINMLTVVASESYAGFVSTLQSEIKADLYERPTKASVDYFNGKNIKIGDYIHPITEDEARAVYNYLVKNDYVDDDGLVTDKYRSDAEAGIFVPLRPELASLSDGIHTLVQAIFDPSVLRDIASDGRKTKVNDNPINDNWKDFKGLWERINKKYAYTVDFESAELIKESIDAINTNLRVAQVSYTLTKGEQDGTDFNVEHTETKKLKRSKGSTTEYDLIGKIAEGTTLTRQTVTKILVGIEQKKLWLFGVNPEEFIAKVISIINRQKASVVIDHITYTPSAEEPYSQNIFNMSRTSDEYAKAFKAKHAIQDYVFTDGISADNSIERRFVQDLDVADEVIVYAKLPRGPKGFYIPTPVGNYSPDWAISFKKGAVKHIFFIAETKGSLDSLKIVSRADEIEEAKIECAKKLFNEISTSGVKYHDVKSYEDLLTVIESL